LIEIYQKIKVDIPKKQFSMPLSLRYIKELASAGIDWHGLHIIDITSLVYSIRIDNARQKLEMDRQKRMSERGIKEIRKATEADFNAL
jgi:hypothetical protein